MNAGVSTRPCASSSVPLLASLEEKLTVKRKSTPLDEHCVAVGKEAVLVAHRVMIGVENPVLAAECANQHQQGRLRQVEVGEQAPDHLELEAGIHEQVRFPRQAAAERR